TRTSGTINNSRTLIHRRVMAPDSCTGVTRFVPVLLSRRRPLTWTTTIASDEVSSIEKPHCLGIEAMGKPAPLFECVGDPAASIVNERNGQLDRIGERCECCALAIGPLQALPIVSCGLTHRNIRPPWRGFSPYLLITSPDSSPV